jgi:uncharacterized membrane protein YeaQ/YmgE (transglycosylase-associated protein family)
MCQFQGKNRGDFRSFTNIVVGLIGGFLAGLLGLGQYGLIGSIIVAFIGACILIAILRAVSGAGQWRRR